MELIWSLTDVGDKWDDAIDKINKNIERRAIETGVVREETEFQEFVIQDMVYTKDSCKLCKKGVVCA